MTYCRNKTGFTLIEALLAAVILAIAAAGVILPFSSGASLEAEGVRLAQAAAIASNLMEKIASKPITDPDTQTAGDYDDVKDYDGYEESQGQIKDPAGDLITSSEYAPFSRQVTCDDVRLAQQSDLFSPTCVQVTVTVAYNGRTMATLTRLVSK